MKYITTRAISMLMILGVMGCDTRPQKYEHVTGAAPYIASDSLDKILQKHSIKAEDIGFILQDLKTGERVAHYNADTLFMPASTAKLFTGYAALKVLGADFQFQTRLCVEDNALYLVGGGDPSLSVENLMAMALKLAKIGANYSAYYYDDSMFQAINYIEDAQPHDAYYNPPVHSLSTKDALVLINWQADEKEGSVQFFQSPDLEPSAANPPTDWLLELDSGASGQARFPQENPALYAATLFRLFANRNDINLPKPTRKKITSTSCDEPVVTNESLPLNNIVAELFETSSNVQAELIGLAVARKLGENPQTLAQSAEVMTKWYQSTFAKARLDGLYLDNHSGLTINSRIAPDHMAALLAQGKFEILALMPISGWKGWLKKRLNTPDVSLRVWAKTGAVNYGIGLAGYMFSKSGQMMAFSIFINDLKARADYDLMNEDDQLQAGQVTSAWSLNAKDTIDEIVRYWVSAN